MKILITGHKGFVGRYFIKKYSSHEIVGIDLVDGNDARDFFKNNNDKFDLVIHLAAIVGGRKNIEGNPLSVAQDLAIDSDMVQWVLRTEPERLVYFSSSAAYPINLQFLNSGILLSEDMIDLNNIEMPDLTYGWSKLTGEFLCSFIKNKTKVFIFRPFSGYAEDQDLDYPFPSFIKRAKDNVKRFDIWGNGFQTRDWIHINDIIDAVDKALELDIPGTYNLGTGIPTSFNSLAQKVIQMSGIKTQINYIQDAPKGVYYRVANIEKMSKFYLPKISLEQGVELALNG
jgi:nucleoside-diphosphate-sugar epimerase